MMLLTVAAVALTTLGGCSSDNGNDDNHHPIVGRWAHDGNYHYLNANYTFEGFLNREAEGTWAINGNYIYFDAQPTDDAPTRKRFTLTNNNNTLTVGETTFTRADPDGSYVGGTGPGPIEPGE